MKKTRFLEVAAFALVMLFVSIEKDENWPMGDNDAEQVISDDNVDYEVDALDTTQHLYNQ